MIKQERLIKRFITLVKISSLSRNERKLADFLHQEFKARGLIVYEDEAGRKIGGNCGNLLVRIPGNSDCKPLLLEAHMDTVEPGENINPIIGEDGIIRSDGLSILASDDKAGIAAIMEACDAVIDNELPHPPLEILFTVGEEQGLQGSKHFDFSLLKATRGIALDSNGVPGEIVIQSPRQNEIKYLVHGRAAHAGMNPEDGLNAIQVMARALNEMPCGRIDEETTCNFGLIKGGQAKNIVAPSCLVLGEARSLSRQKLDALTEQLVKTFKQKTTELGARPEVEVKFNYPEIIFKPDDEIVRIVCAAVRSIGLTPRTIKTGGGSDASIISGHNIQCANLGIGMSAIHTTEEFIKIQDLVDSARLVLAIIMEAGK